MPRERAAAVVVKAWMESDAAEGFRARITQTPDLDNPDTASVTVAATVDAVVAAVKAFLDAFIDEARDATGDAAETDR